jgi:hypothetical protein
MVIRCNGYLAENYSGAIGGQFKSTRWQRLRWRIDSALDRALRRVGLARISRPPPEWDRDE